MESSEILDIKDLRVPLRPTPPPAGRSGMELVGAWIELDIRAAARWISSSIRKKIRIQGRKKKGRGREWVHAAAMGRRGVGWLPG